MRKKAIIIALSACVCGLVNAEVFWTGSGDGTSVFQEANWQDSATGLAPADGTIDVNTPLNGGTAESYSISNATGVATPASPGQHVLLGNAGTTLSLENSSLDAKNTSGLKGEGVVNINTGSDVIAQFVIDLTVNIDATSTLTLKGGGNPVNASTVNLEDGAIINFFAETVEDVRNEHYGSIFIGGTALSSLVEGEDFTIISDGGSGAILQAGRITVLMSASPLLIEAGGSTEITVEFDPSASSAILTNNIDATIIDLLAADGDNDGVVVTTQTPATNVIYTAVVTVDSEEHTDSVSINIFVEPPVNSFSTAVLSYNPLFYYQFEEGAGAGFLVDSSTNANHVESTGTNLVQGGSMSGAVGNAGLCPDNVAIITPAISEMSESFTAMALVNSVYVGNETQVMFAMEDGTGTGRSIFYITDTGLLSSFINGSGGITSSVVVASNTTYMLSMVYDAETGDGTDDPEIRYYINGDLNTTTSNITVGANLGKWRLAANKTGAQNFNGWMDETALIPSVLSGTQINDLYMEYLGQQASYAFTAIELDASGDNVTFSMSGPAHSDIDVFSSSNLQVEEITNYVGTVMISADGLGTNQFSTGGENTMFYRASK